MNRKLLKEILAAHADQLVKGRAENQDYQELLSNPAEELAPLLNVAERIKSTLKPIAPTGQFEEELKRQLLTTAHLRRVEGYTPPNPTRDLWMVTAILGFFISLAGVLLALKLRTATNRLRQLKVMPIPQTFD